MSEESRKAAFKRWYEKNGKEYYRAWREKKGYKPRKSKVATPGPTPEAVAILGGFSQPEKAPWE